MHGGHSNIWSISKFFNICKYPFYELVKNRIAPGLSIRHYFVSSKRSISLEILLVNNFKTPFTFLFPIEKANFLDNPPMFFDMLM